MFTTIFERETPIASQPELQAIFKSDRVYLVTGARVVFCGETTIGPDVTLSGDCRFLGPTQIDKGSTLTNVRFGHGNVVRAYSILSDAAVGNGNIFGPFCFIRDKCRIADDCIVGAYVETARSTFDVGVKISHQAFVGDAEIGARTIIGAGVVFCNFDGRGRQRIQIGPDVTIGSGSLLIPPLVIGKDATIGAGSTVTKDVAAGTKLIQKR